MSPEAPGLNAQAPNALLPGTRLGEFEVLRLLGVGGFGIVYLAMDHALEREVAVKEYMPASLAGRTETLHVSLRSQSDADTFALGLRSFVNEARLLARFDHPSLLKVHRFWEANGTAYMAMPVLRGRTLKELRRQMDSPPGEVWLRDLLLPLLGAIEKLHSEGVYHRDIAPDNIQIEPDGRPVLLDFGAARRVISDKSQNLTAILKPAYAPIEQYGEAGSVRQGPWTDIYALGATLHYLLLGRPPAPATARTIHDDASPLSGQPLPGCGEGFLHIIDWMLSPRPGDRPQSVAELRDALEGRLQPPVRARVANAPQADWQQTVVSHPTAAQTTQTAGRPGAADLPTQATDTSRWNTTIGPVPKTQRTEGLAPTVVVERTQPATAAFPPLKDPPQATGKRPVAGAGSAGSVATSSGGSGRMIAIAGGVAAVVAIAAFAFWPRDKRDSPVVAGPAPATVSQTPSPGAVSPAAPELVARATPPAESAIATVTLPGTPRAPSNEAPSAGSQLSPPAAPVAERARPNVLQSSPKVTTAVGPSTQRTPAAGRNGQDTSAAPTSTNPEPAPTPAPAVVSAVKPEVALPQTRPPEPAVPAAPSPAPVETAKAPLAPEALCAGRSTIGHFACMEKACRPLAMSSHPDCQNWRKAAQPKD